MSTGPWHYRESERLLQILTKPTEHGGTVINASMNPNVVAAAQAHALLALAAATALCQDGGHDAAVRQWMEVAS